MTRTVRRFNDLTQLDLDWWDSLLGSRSFYTSSPWMKHAAKSAETPPVYVTVSGNTDKFECGLCAYPLGLETPYVFCSPLRFVQSRAGYSNPPGEDWASRLLPALACGGRNPSHTKISASSTATAEDLELLVEEAEQAAWQHNCNSVCFLNVDDDDVSLQAALERRAFVRIENQFAYSLEVPDSFDEYLSVFDHKRRTAVRREIRALEDAKVEYRLQSLSAELIDSILPLELSLYRKYGTPADERAFRNVFMSLIENAPDVTRVLTAEINGSIAGFVLFFTWNGEYYARQAGFDYELQGKLPLYFGLVYYQLLKLAIQENVSQILYSAGSDLTKLSRGCIGIQQIAYIKARDPELASKLKNLQVRSTQQ